ncbi:Phosphotransferase enzyme family protein [Arboricoccus pini]|uniref:Phosphotransferase enzyme family protein n=1 Tax=Arboricoccus pini TaxID=1963835 RepID=A0A212RKA8_9PROT|nr:phosphotransferase [Arboricoccus pini]SNB72895.1 Phosphotransferase enzyme family protein [Arboricoccus pini]
MKTVGEAEGKLETRVEAILRQLPDGEGEPYRYAPALGGVVSPIHRGVATTAWLVAKGDAPPHLFLKLPEPEMASFLDPTGDFAAARVAAEAGVSPAPRYLIDDAILFDYLPAPFAWARLHQFLDPTVRARLIAAKRAIQAAPSMSRKRELGPRLAAFAGKIETLGIALPPDGWWLIRQGAGITEAIASAGQDVCPCHLDGVSSNVMLHPDGRLQLVDFDLAGDADPHWDLGTVMAEICQFEDEEAALVELFLGGYDRRVHHRARLLGAADDIAWGLWGYLLARLSPRSHVEFVKYAEWRFLRARMVLHDPRFEAMLRHV